MVLRSLRRRLLQLFFGPPSQTAAPGGRPLCEKPVEVCTAEFDGFENCHCFSCLCKQRQDEVQRKIKKIDAEKAEKAAKKRARKSKSKRSKWGPDDDDVRYPPCDLDEDDVCYWYYAGYDEYAYMTLIQDLFGPDRPVWLKVYPNFPTRPERKHPKAVICFPHDTTQDEESMALYILEWCQLPEPGTYGRPAGKGMA